MKQYRFVFLFMIALIGGCQSHFHKVRENAIYFYLHQPEARRVELRCSFDGFKPHPATKTDDDTWEVTVPFTSEFIYFYIVDDRVFLPSCRLKEKDDFGTENCIFIPEM